MRATDDTLHHQLIAGTYADLAKAYSKARRYKQAAYFAGKARKEWLKVKWENRG